MPGIFAEGDKFAIVALEARSDVDMPIAELAPSLWVSSTSAASLDESWSAELGSIAANRLEDCTIWFGSKTNSDDPAELNALNNRVRQYYGGLMLASRFGTDQNPFFITGLCCDGRLNATQISTLHALTHASADRWARLTSADVTRAIDIGSNILAFPWIGSRRFDRIYLLYQNTRTVMDWMDRIHQYTRCLDGLTIPPHFGTANHFADRMTPIVDPAQRDYFRDMYQIRGAIEHLREEDRTEPFERAARLELVKMAGIAEYTVRSSLVRILERQQLWGHFATKASLQAFWTLSGADREQLWGPRINPLDGIAGFDETQWSDQELGAP